MSWFSSEFLRIYFHLELGGDASIVGHVGYAGNLAQAGDDDPFVEVGELA